MYIVREMFIYNCAIQYDNIQHKRSINRTVLRGDAKDRVPLVIWEDRLVYVS